MTKYRENQNAYSKIVEILFVTKVENLASYIPSVSDKRISRLLKKVEKNAYGAKCLGQAYLPNSLIY